MQAIACLEYCTMFIRKLIMQIKKKKNNPGQTHLKKSTEHNTPHPWGSYCSLIILHYVCMFNFFLRRAVIWIFLPAFYFANVLINNYIAKHSYSFFWAFLKLIGRNQKLTQQHPIQTYFWKSLPPSQNQEELLVEISGTNFKIFYFLFFLQFYVVPTIGTR